MPDTPGSSDARRDWKDDIAGGVVTFVIEAAAVVGLAVVAVIIAALALLLV